MIKGVTRQRVQVPNVRLATALMYHSVRDARGRQDANADDIYTISDQQFRDHLQSIQDARLPVSTISDIACREISAESEAVHAGRMLELVRDARPHGPVSSRPHAVVLTFNDGLASHLDSVLHLLWEYNMPGEFFVYPAKVGRSGYLSWSELRGMASAGMSIQSHGYSQRYLDDLGDTAVANELIRSKKVIEDRLGEPVTVFAAPGGRINAFIAALAQRVGYRAVCGSRPGHWRLPSRKPVVPRIAVRATTTVEDINNWINIRRLSLTAQTGRYRMLQAARWALGNDVYDNLRQRYLGDH